MDWGVDNEHDVNICDMALAHEIGGKVRQAYLHTKLMEKRRKLMESWAAFCSGQPNEPKSDGDNVVPFRSVA
jgi:hypothetical protein